jgi:hypothetical protein
MITIAGFSLGGFIMPEAKKLAAKTLFPLMGNPCIMMKIDAFTELLIA